MKSKDSHKNPADPQASSRMRSPIFGWTVLVQREMDFCLIGVNRKWVTVTNLF
jgi:hypothetical protein